MTTTSKTVAATTPQAPNQRAARMPDQGGRHQLADEHQQQDRVEEALGVLDQPDQRPWPRAGRRPPGAMALARLVRTRLVSARASTAETASRTTTTTMQDHVGSAVNERGRRPARRWRPVTSAAPVEAGQQLALAPLHPLGLLVVLVVHARAGGGCRGRRAGRSRRRRSRRARRRCGRPPPGRRPRRRAGGMATSSGSIDAGPGPALVGRAAAAARARRRWGRRARRSGPSSPRNRSLQLGDGRLVDEEQRHLDVVRRPPRPRARSGPAPTQRSMSTGWSDCSSAAKTSSGSPARPSGVGARVARS